MSTVGYARKLCDARIGRGNLLLKFMAISLFCLLSTSANAYQGLDLGRDCRSSDDAGLARCEGFISGFIAGAQIDIEGDPINMWRSYGYTWCGPLIFEVSDIVDALFEASRTGQATPHFPAAVMLAQSLAAAYPCTGTSSSGFPGQGFPPVNPDQ